MPDFLKMTSTGKSGRGQDSLNKPYGDKAFVDPFSESNDSADMPKLSIGLVKTLNHMSNKIGINNKALLSEAENKKGDHNGEA